MEINLSNKNALVGGSTQGLGYAAAFQLASCGAGVTLMARNEEKLKRAVNSLPITSQNQSHNYIVADFSDFESFQAIISKYFDTHTIDILVNNTNGPSRGTALEQNIATYQSAFDLLFKTVCLTTSLALPHMMDQGFGRIINISSVSVKEPIQNLVLSNTVRSATLAWAKSLAGEIAKNNVTVNSILTGFFDTERLKETIDSSTSIEEVKKSIAEKVPMNRLGQPKEYGYLVAFLASEYAAYITGASLPIDGGLIKGY